MKIGIDISAMGEPNYTGVGVYVENLIQSLAEVDNENEYFLCYRLSRLKKKWMKNPVKADNFHFKIIQEPFNFFFERSLDVFHGPADRLPDYKYPKMVVTVHDLAALLGGDFMTDSFRQMVASRYEELIGNRADKIITVSESSKKDICQQYKLSSEKVDVCYPGVAEHFKPVQQQGAEAALKELGINFPYVLNVGAQQERKNITGAVEAFADYIKATNDAEVKLVLCGKATYGFERTLKRIEELNLKSRVQVFGHVSQQQLVALYSAARMLLFPSFFEGFGFPIVEAFATGCPVITSNLTSMPEVAGGAAMIINPHDTKQITAAMIKLSAKEQREKYIKLGRQRAAEFSWQEAARKTLDIYKALV